MWVRPAGPGVVDGALDGSLGISTDLLTVTPALLMGIAMLGARGRQKRPVVGAEKSPPRALADPRSSSPRSRWTPASVGMGHKPALAEERCNVWMLVWVPLPSCGGKSGEAIFSPNHGDTCLQRAPQSVNQEREMGHVYVCVCARAPLK